MMQSIRRYLDDRSGATALEFAIVAVPLFAGIFAIIELSYKSILQTELDNKLYVVATELGINNYTADTASEFIQNQFCQDIGTTFLACDKVEIGVDVLVNRPYTYRNQSMIGRWDLGCTNDTILIEMNYPVEHFIHPVIIGDVIERNNTKYYRARGVIRREPLLSGGISC